MIIGVAHRSERGDLEGRRRSDERSGTSGVQAPVLAEQVQARSYPPTAGKPGVPSLQVRIPALLDDYKKKRNVEERK